MTAERAVGDRAFIVSIDGNKALNSALVPAGLQQELHAPKIAFTLFTHTPDEQDVGVCLQTGSVQCAPNGEKQRRAP